MFKTNRKCETHVHCFYFLSASGSSNKVSFGMRDQPTIDLLASCLSQTASVFCIFHHRLVQISDFQFLINKQILKKMFKLAVLSVLILTALAHQVPIGCDHDAEGEKKNFMDVEATPLMEETKHGESGNLIIDGELYSVAVSVAYDFVLSIELTNSDLMTRVQTKEIHRDFHLLGRKENIVMTVQESDVAGVWEYVAYQFDNAVQEHMSELHLIYKFEWIEGFEMRQVLNRVNDPTNGINCVFCVLQNDSSTDGAIYEFDLIEEKAKLFAETPLEIQAVLGGTNEALIAEQVPFNLDDPVSVAVYLFEGGQYVRNEIVGNASLTSLSGFNFEDVEVQNWMGDIVNVHSWNQQRSVVWGFFIKGQEVVEEYDIAAPSQAQVYTETDFLQNGIAVTPLNLHWVHFRPDGSSIRIETAADPNLSNETAMELIYDFHEVEHVALDNMSMFVFTQKQTLSVYELVEVDGMPGEFTIEKSAEIGLHPEIVKAFEVDEPMEIRMRLSCSCFEARVVRFTCFSATLNCISTTANIKYDCTAPVNLKFDINTDSGDKDQDPNPDAGNSTDTPDV